MDSSREGIGAARSAASASAAGTAKVKVSQRPSAASMLLAPETGNHDRHPPSTTHTNVNTASAPIQASITGAFEPGSSSSAGAWPAP